MLIFLYILINTEVYQVLLYREKYQRMTNNEYPWLEKLKQEAGEIKDQILIIQRNMEKEEISDANTGRNLKSGTSDDIEHFTIHNKCLLPLAKILLSRKYKEKDANVFIQDILEKILIRVVKFLKHVDHSQNDISDKKSKSISIENGIHDDCSNISDNAEKERESLIDDCFLILKEITTPTSTYNTKYGYVAAYGEKATGEKGGGEDSDSSDDEEEVEVDPAWRSKIGFADWVDFLNEKKNTWSRAQIVEENRPEFKFKIQRDGDTYYQAEWVEIFSENIAPQNTKTKEAQKKIKKFQRKLKVNDLLDAKGGASGIWYSGKAIEFRKNDKDVEEVKIRYDNHVVDAWVQRYGTEITPLYTHTEKITTNIWTGTNYSSNVVEKSELYTIGDDDSDESDDDDDDDSDTGSEMNDSINEQKHISKNNSNYIKKKKNYAATHFKYRKGHVYSDQSLSDRVCNILEEFYKIGGWDALHNNVGTSLKRIQLYVDIFSNLNYTACKCFCKEYYDKVLILINHNMILLNTNDLRSLNLAKIDAMIKKLEMNVLPRVRKDTKQAAEYNERFFLVFSMFLFKCDLLPRRLDGLKRLLELADSTKRYHVKKAKFLESEHILKCFREEDLLIELFKVGQHQEVLRRSTEVLKWLASNSSLELVDVQMLWEAGNTTGRDIDTTSLIYKIICELSNQYDEEHYIFFAKMFAEETLESINIQKLNAMAELGNDGARKSQDASSKIGQILLKFCLSDSPVINGATDAFVKFIKSYFLKSQKSEYCLQCFQNLIDQKDIAQTLMLFPRIIETFDDKSYYNSPTKTSIIKSMDHNGKDVIDIVLELPDTYTDDILKFLGTFMPLTKKKLSSSIIKRLWSEKTHEQMCKWVAYSGIQELLEDESQIYIIENVICQVERVELASRNEFDCLCQLFFLLNERFRNISKNSKDKTKCTVLTSNLYKIQSIWNCAIYAKDDKVGSDAIELLISLCDEETWDSHLQSVCFLSQDDLLMDSSNLSIECGKSSKVVMPLNEDVTLNKIIDAKTSDDNHGMLKKEVNGDDQTTVSSNVITNDNFSLYYDPWEMHVDQCCTYLSKPGVYNDRVRVKRCFQLLEGVLGHSQRFGLKGLRAHVHRSRGRPVKPCIRCDDTKFYLEGFANDTLWAMREAIALNLRVGANDFDLYMNRNDIKITFEEKDNSKTLFQNNFRKRENVFVKLKHKSTKKSVSEVTTATPIGTMPYSTEATSADNLGQDQKNIDSKVNPSNAKRVIVKRTYKKSLLLLSNQNPTLRYEQVVSTIFAQHSSDGKMMTRDEIIDYFVYCGASGTSLEDSRIGDIISKNDCNTNENGDLCMTRNGFLQFYTEAAASRLENVWKDLKKHGYDDNLVRVVKTVTIAGKDGISREKIIHVNATIEPNDVQNSVNGDKLHTNNLVDSIDTSMLKLDSNFHLIERGAEHMPRYWLVHKKRYREILFNFLDDNIDGITHTAWDFMMSLPTNPDTLDSIRRFQGKATPNWKKVFNPKSVYSLVYNLQIVDFLIDPVDVDSNSNAGTNDSANGPFSNNPTPVNSPIRRKKKKGHKKDGEGNDNSLGLSRSLSIEEIDMSMALDDAVSWKLQFLQRGGFLYLLHIFLERNVVSNSSSVIENSLETLANGLLLKLVRTFLLAAMSSSGTNYHDIAELVRRRSSENKSLALDSGSNIVLLNDDDLHFKRGERDMGNGLQILLQQNLSIPSSPSSVERLVNSNVISPKMSALLMDLGTTPPPGEDFLSLVRQMSDGGSHTVAENIMENIDLVKLQIRLFDFLIVCEKALTFDSISSSYRDVQKNNYNTKRIIERAVGLWVALTVYEPLIFEKFVESKELRRRFFTCLLSPCKDVRREMAHAARILSCIDKNNNNYNQNEDPPTIILLKVLLSKIYDENNISHNKNDKQTSVHNDLKNHGEVYDYCYDLSASILLDVLGMKNQEYYDAFNLNLLSKIMVNKIISCFISSNVNDINPSMHAIGAMKILKTILANIDDIKDSRSRNGIKESCRSASLAGILLRNIVFSEVGYFEVEDLEAKNALRSTTLQLIESLVFLDKFRVDNAEDGTNLHEKNGVDNDDMDEDLMFGSASDFDFDNEDSDTHKTFPIDEYSSSRVANWRDDAQYGIYDILCQLDDVHISIQEAPLKTLNMAINSMQRHENKKKSKVEPSSVGIQNLGSTCYMNSVFQQLYAIKDFRDAVLTSQLVRSEIRDDANDNEEENKKKTVVILDSVQEMFWRMELTNLPYVTAEAFCSKFQFYNGTPLNVKEQQDASEFFNRLCDLMKENLDKIKGKNFVTETVGGSYVNRYTCKACKRVHDSEQEMYNLHLSVKDRANIYESLKANYTSPELLSGYKCEKCGKSDQTEKVCLLKRLPNVLICSLKRFELNYNTFLREKVNSKFEFPEELNLWKYTDGGFDQNNVDNQEDGETEADDVGNNTTKDAKEDVVIDNLNSNDQNQTENRKEEVDAFDNSASEEDGNSSYRLKGIVIHSGSANGGHYYSFIKNQNNDNWTEYNDLIVRSWDCKTRLVRDCFGGSDNTNNTWTWQAKNDNHQSAYMLVYERIGSNLRNKNLTMAKYHDKGVMGNRNIVNLHDKYLPGKVGEQIASENKYFSQLQRTFDAAYLNFLANVIEKISEIEVQSYTRINLSVIDNLDNYDEGGGTKATDGLDLYFFVLRSYLYIFRRAGTNVYADYNDRVGRSLRKLFALHRFSKRESSLCF